MGLCLSIRCENLSAAYIRAIIVIMIVATPPVLVVTYSFPLRMKVGKLSPKTSMFFKTSPVIHDFILSGPCLLSYSTEVSKFYIINSNYTLYI